MQLSFGVERICRICRKTRFVGSCRMVELPVPTKTGTVPFGLPSKRTTSKPPLKAACPLCRQVAEVPPCAEYAPVVCPGCGLRYKLNTGQNGNSAKSNPSAPAEQTPADPILQQWLAGAPITPPQLTQWQRLLRWCRKNPAKGALVLGVLCLLVVASAAGTAGFCVTKLRLHRTARSWQQAEQERLQAEALAAEQARLAAEKQRQAEAEAAARQAAERRAQQAEAQRRRAELERLEAEKQRQQAARQARLALAEQQAKDALLLLRSQPLQSCLLAAASLRTKIAEGVAADLSTQQILCDALAELGVPALRGHDGVITVCQTDRQGRLLITAGEDGTLRIWNLEAATACWGNTCGNAAELPRPATAVSSPPRGATPLLPADGKRAAVGHEANQPIVLRVHGEAISTITISPDGRRLVSGDRAGLLVLWDLTAPDLASRATIIHQFSGPVNAVAFSSDGRWLVAAAGRPDSMEDTARLWELSAHGQLGAGLPLRGHFGQVRAAAISPDNNWLATAGADKTVRLWNLRCGFPSAEQIVLHGHENQAAAVAFACDGRWLASASYDGTVRLWNLRQADPAAGPRVLSGHNGWVDVMEVSPDGRYLATAGYDRSVRLWDLHAADPRDSCLLLFGHTARVRKILFLADGRRLATASDDRTVRLWDLSAASTAAQSLVLRGHWGPVVSMCVGNNGRSLITGCGIATASGHAAARIWPLETTDLLAQATRVCQLHSTAGNQQSLNATPSQQVSDFSAKPPEPSDSSVQPRDPSRWSVQPPAGSSAQVPTSLEAPTSFSVQMPASSPPATTSDVAQKQLVGELGEQPTAKTEQALRESFPRGFFGPSPFGANPPATEAVR